MFDLRYHVASLAAVFLALAVGILLGVAISGNLRQAENSLRANELADLNRALEIERLRSDAARRRGEAAEELVERAYPALMNDRLAEKDFALVFLGPVDGEIRSAVEATLADAGSGTPTRMIALDVPLDPEALDEFLEGSNALARYTGDDFTELGRDLGGELVDGGETPLWTTLSSELVEERNGTASPPVDGAVVVRSWLPDETAEGEQADEVGATETLIDGLLQGLEDSDLPVVGVETTSNAQSTVPVFRERGISTVDDVDAIAGRVALAILLAGGDPGHYGVKDSATDGVAPPVEPVPAEASE